MSARVFAHHLEFANPSRTSFLQPTTQLSRASLKIRSARSLRSHALQWKAEYANSHDEGGVSANLGLVHENGFSLSREVVNGFNAAAATDEEEEDEYYVPVIGHRVLGVVVSGSHVKLDVDIGASKLAQLQVPYLLPLDRLSIAQSKWILRDDACPDEDHDGGVPSTGRPLVLYDVDVFEGDASSETLVEVGTVLDVEVTGHTADGAALLSARKAASRVAWDRVVQIKDENEPLEVVITELNSSGLIARVEGLRAFLPHTELIKKPDPLKAENYDSYLGRTVLVTLLIAREIRGNLILSEKDAWIKRNLRPWSLHDGTVTRLLPYGALVLVHDTDIWGMIHISNIANARIAQVSDVFEIGEQVKMLLVESPVPDRYSFSTALLESEPGLMLQDKQRVFREAEERAAELKKSFAVSKASIVKEEDDAEDATGESPPWKIIKPISNWDWLDFSKEESSVS